MSKKKGLQVDTHSPSTHISCNYCTKLSSSPRISVASSDAVSPVTKNVCLDIGFVPPVQKSANGRERYEPITNERLIRNSLYYRDDPLGKRLLGLNRIPDVAKSYSLLLRIAGWFQLAS